MSLTFSDICELLDTVEKISIRRPRLPPERERPAIEKTISQWFCKYRAAISNRETDGGALLSVLFPHRRKDRVYGLKPRSLSKKIINLLKLNHGEQTILAQWQSQNAGDLGVCLERALKHKDGTFKKPPVFPLKRVDDLLVQLAARYRFSDPAIQNLRKYEFDTEAELRFILLRLRSWEAKWLIRLILREHCTIHWDENLVFTHYHFLLPDLLQFQNDFDMACQLLQGELSCFPAVPAADQESSMRIEAARKLRAVVGTKVGRPAFHKAWSFTNLFQLTGDRAWAAEAKYDGEYCEIHIDLKQSPIIKIFSKNGKDATNDRRGVHDNITKALRIGAPDCPIKKNCIILGELVLYSDREQKILPFSKIRKHVTRSGSFLGTMQDSLPHDWEHLMIVFFDVLVVDDKPILREELQIRRRILKELVLSIPGRSMRSEWSLVDFKTEHGITDVKQAFARSLALRQEGLVLKPLHAPYFPLLSEVGHRHRGYFIKLKKDYLADMGGERDLGDFAIIGASFDAQVAAKLDLMPLHWTHFHLGCLVNKAAVERSQAKPIFKIVSTLSLDKCVPKPEAKYLNVHGRLLEVDLPANGRTAAFNVEGSKGYGPAMGVAFKKPFVAEVLGGGFEKQQNECFEMLRHPRLKKVHHDRDWKDAVTMEELERMADQKWEIPDAAKLDGHARDVAFLVKKYARKMDGSQCAVSESYSTQETTQCTTPRTTQETPRSPKQATLDGAVVQETQPCTPCTWSTTSTTQVPGSTQSKGIKASKQIRILVREDTAERIARQTELPDSQDHVSGAPPEASPPASDSPGKRRSCELVLTPPPLKRRKLRSPLKDAATNRNLGTFKYDSQEKTIHIYVE
jgi:DNA ligase-4